MKIAKSRARLNETRDAYFDVLFLTTYFLNIPVFNQEKEKERERKKQRVYDTESAVSREMSKSRNTRDRRANVASSFRAFSLMRNLFFVRIDAYKRTNDEMHAVYFIRGETHPSRRGS